MKLRLMIIFFAMFMVKNEVTAQEFPVLQISKNGHDAILIGSNHLRPNALKPNEKLDLILGSKKTVCFEFDMSDAASVDITKKTILGGTGPKLNERFSELNVKKIQKKVSLISQNFDAINALSPLVLYGILENLNPKIALFNKSLKPIHSVDYFLKQSMLKSKAKILGLEDRFAVLDAYNQVSNAKWESLIERFLEFLDCEVCVDNYISHGRAAYSSESEPESVYKHLMLGLGDDFQLRNLYDEIFIKPRNAAMAEKITSDVLESGKCEVVAIGSAHLGGKSGVLEHLRTSGVNISILSF